jgi:RNA polymerase sigma-70 factor (ECF subfamily)
MPSQSHSNDIQGQDELVLVKGCLKGKPEMQTALYHRYVRIMFGVCLRYCSSRVEAEDILQQGFVKVFLNLSRFRDGSLEGWIRRIMVRESIDHFRKNRKSFFNNSVEFPENIIDESEDGLANLESSELMDLITGLPEGCRQVFNMYAIEGYNHREISEMLGISEGTSKAQYHRARQLLKKKIIVQKT